MDDLLVRRADGGQDAAQLGARGVAVASHEVIRTEPHASFHGHKLAALEIEPLGLDQAWLVITLQDAGRTPEAGERLIHRRRPIGMGKVAAEIDAARAPGAG